MNRTEPRNISGFDGLNILNDENCSVHSQNNLSKTDSDNIGNDCLKAEVKSLSDSEEESSVTESNESPIVFRSPVININTNISKENEKIINNYDNFNKNSQEKVSKSVKSQTKSKYKFKLRDPNVKVKSKFSQKSINFISELLKDEVFSGWVEERKFVEKLNDYRDIIEIDEWEDELNTKLRNVMLGVRGVMEGTKWINITVPSSHSPAYCLWVLLESPPFPGHYWMQITDITIDPKMGLQISVKVLREVHIFDGESFSQRQKRLKGETSPDEWKEWALAVTTWNLKGLWSNFFSVLTPSNIGSTIRLVVVLTATLTVGIAKFVERSWDFLLRLLREIGIFIHHATPLAQSVIAFFEKIMGGFYLLLAMIYKDFRQPKGPPPNIPDRPLRGSVGSPSGPRPITYVSENSWVFKQ